MLLQRGLEPHAEAVKKRAKYGKSVPVRSSGTHNRPSVNFLGVHVGGLLRYAHEIEHVEYFGAMCKRLDSIVSKGPPGKLSFAPD